MIGEDLVLQRTGVKAPSRFDFCTGVWASRNNCFSDLDRDDKSCQGSTIVWCELALNGQYEIDPHKRRYGQVLNTQMIYDTFKTFSDVWETMVRNGLPALQAGLEDRGMQIQGNIARSNRATDAVREVRHRHGVLLIFSEAYHATASAFLDNNAVYYYDNDVGLCLCPNVTDWMAWVQWCDEHMLGQAGTTGSWNAQVKEPYVNWVNREKVVTQRKPEETWHHLLFMNVVKQSI